MLHGLFALAIVFCVLAALYWLFTSVIPLPAPLRTVAIVLIVLVGCVYLLHWGGVWDVGTLR